MAKEYDMEIGSFIRFGMESAKRHWLKFLGVNLGALAAILILTSIAARINGNFAFLVFLSTSIIFSFGIFKNVIRLASNRSFDIRAFLPDLPVLANYIIGMLIVILLVIIGLLCFILPGLFLGVKMNLVPFLIVDKRMSFVEAISESWHLTSGHVADISFGYLISNAVIAILALPLLTIPFLIPMAAFIQMYPYVQLVGLAHAPEEKTAITPEADSSPVAE